MDKAHLELDPEQGSPRAAAAAHAAHGESLAEAVRADLPVEDDRRHAKTSDPPMGTRQGAAPHHGDDAPPPADS